LKIGNERHVDACSQMQQYPTPDKLHRHAAERKHQLRNQHQIDKRQVAVSYTLIDNALGKKREQQLQHAAKQQPQKKLHHHGAERPQVAKQKTERSAVRLLVPCRVKLGRGLQQQGYAFGNPVFDGRSSAFYELVFGKFHETGSRVGHMHRFVVFFAGNFIDHYKVVLVPMDYSGEGSIRKKFIERNFNPKRPKTDTFC